MTTATIAKKEAERWSFNGQNYVLGRVNRQEYDSLYKFFEERSYNCIFIEKNGMFGNKKLIKVEEEEIPSHILIEIGCFGSFDPKNWQPKIFSIAKEKYGKPDLVEKEILEYNI